MPKIIFIVSYIATTESKMITCRDGRGTKATIFDADVFPPLSTAKTLKLKLNLIPGSKYEPLMKRMFLVNAGSGSKVQSYSSMSSVIVSISEIEEGVRS